MSPSCYETLVTGEGTSFVNLQQKKLIVSSAPTTPAEGSPKRAIWEGQREGRRSGEGTRSGQAAAAQAASSSFSALATVQVEYTSVPPGFRCLQQINHSHRLLRNISQGLPLRMETILNPVVILYVLKLQWQRDVRPDKLRLAPPFSGPYWTTSIGCIVTQMSSLAVILALAVLQKVKKMKDIWGFRINVIRFVRNLLFNIISLKI